MKIKKTLNSLWKTAKNHKKKGIFIFVVLVAIAFFVLGKDSDNKTETSVAEVGVVIQEVSISGKVVSAQSLDLSFEQTGKINYVGAKSGQRVVTGQVLVSLNAAELVAKKQMESANVKSAQIRLNQALAVNDLNVLETSLKNAEKNRLQTRVSGSSEKARQSLQAVINAVIVLTDMQYKYFSNNTSEAGDIDSAKEALLYKIYGQSNLGKAEAWYFLPIETGMNQIVSESENGNLGFNYEKLLGDIKTVSVMTRDVMSELSIRMSGVSSATSIDKDSVSATVDSLNGQIGIITLQERSVVSAQNAVGDAKARFSSNTKFETEILRADLDRAKASLALIDAQLARNSIRSPFNGVATNIDIKVGQIVGPSVPVVSIIGDAKFQIETNIPEADIAKLKTGNEAIVTLDAYGRDKKFKAKIIHIDPAGRVVNSIVTYKVTLEFEGNETTLLSGLTADIDIQTNKKEGVVYISSRDIITKDNKKFVKVLIEKEINPSHLANLSVVSSTNEFKIVEVPIETGLKGSDGRTEIISGIKAGDKVLKN